MKTRYLMSALTMALFSLALVAPAAFPADLDQKIYPASMCVRYMGDQPRLNASRVFNPGTTVMRLDCPVIHDWNTAPIYSGWVDVIDQNFGVNTPNDENYQVCAQLVSYNAAAGTASFSSRHCSMHASSSIQRLAFLDPFPVMQDAHYFYSVTIPPVSGTSQSAIASYSVREWAYDN